MNFVCRNCGATTPVDSLALHCRCGGLFDLDWRPAASAWSQRVESDNSLWRYRSLLPIGDDGLRRRLSLGEGNTPLVELDEQVMVKLDFLTPTLSYKDRGAVVLVAAACALGVDTLIADSSGNAGTAIAAYAARAGIAAHIYVAASISTKKRAQLERFSAVVHAVPGSREDVAAAALEAVVRTGAFYASHVYNPFFHHGTKTFAYELVEQYGGTLPDAVFLPAGNGTLLIGVALGFSELVEAGVLVASPRLIAVQASACAPLVDPDPQGLFPSATAAEGIAIADPKRREQMLEVVAASKGNVVTVDEHAIVAARAELARSGIDVEPTAAVTLAAYRAGVATALGERVLIALGGAGLKAADDEHALLGTRG